MVRPIRAIILHGLLISAIIIIALCPRALGQDSGYEPQTTRAVSFEGKRSVEEFHGGAFSSKGKRVALMSIDNIDVMKLTDRQTLYSIRIPHSTFLHVAYAPDDKTIAASYEDDSGVKIGLWEAETGRHIRTFPAGDEEGDVSFSDDGQLLATGSGEGARLLDVKTGNVVKEISAPSNDLFANRVLLSPDGRWLAVHFRDVRPFGYSAVHVYDLQTGDEQVLQTEVYRDWEFSADSSRLAISATTDKGKITQRSVAEVWEVGGWQRKLIIDGKVNSLAAYSVGFSPDGGLIAVGGNRRFAIYSAATGELKAIMTHREGGGSALFYDVTTVEFSRKKDWLLTASEGGLVRLWKIRPL